MEAILACVNAATLSSLMSVTVEPSQPKKELSEHPSLFLFIFLFFIQVVGESTRVHSRQRDIPSESAVFIYACIISLENAKPVTS